MEHLENGVGEINLGIASITIHLQLVGSGGG